MGDQDGTSGAGDDASQEDLEAVYGEELGGDFEAIPTGGKRRSFAPWHHPVKQIVRDTQWAGLTRRHIRDGHVQGGILRYFTLPGADLLDVRVLAEVCEPERVQIEYFGFDSGMDPENPPGPRVETESALRQAGRITDSAIILPDRLEDIAVERSQAAQQLGNRLPFHVVNIDACDHLAYQPPGRPRSTFDALTALLRHQMLARGAWLLFVTTRAEPHLLGNAGLAMQRAVNENLAVPDSGFGGALAAAIQADDHLLAAAVAQAWTTHDDRFLRLYSVALAKYLLQFFHSQPNLPANVELASAAAYRVYGEAPDMLSLAFRIIPDGPRAFQASAQGMTAIGDLEPERAERICERAHSLRDLDDELSAQGSQSAAVARTVELLKGANYDMPAYLEWLAGLARRPLQLPPSILSS